MSKREKELRQKIAQPVKPTQNPRPIQHRKKGPGNNSKMLVALEPAQTPLAIAFRHVEPTWRNYIYYADLAAKGGDEDMQKYIKTYEALPLGERRTVMPEMLCDLSGVKPRDLISAVAGEVWQHKQAESTISASINHPKVIHQTAQYAIESPAAYKDRELFLRATGALPDKKGASIVINNNPQAANTIAMPTLNGFKSMDARVIDMSKLLDEPAEELPLNAPQGADVFEEAD